MKKKWPVKQIVSIALSLVLVAGIVVLLAVAADGSELTQATGEILTPIGFEKKPIDPAQGMQQVAKRGNLVLRADLQKAAIELENTATGEVWDSVPADADENKELKGAAKLSISSLLTIRYANRDANTTTQNVLVGSVNKGNFHACSITNGIRFEFYFEKEGFFIPIELTLTDKGLAARVPVKEIKEASNQMLLTSIVVLPGFGAQKENAPGYLFVPDGSGMTMPFVKGESGYSSRIYGNDCSIVSKTKTETDTVARLPVFGISTIKRGLLAIVTAGDARAKVIASVPSSKSPYATVAGEFIYRESILVDVSQKTFEFTQVNMFENTPCQLDAFAVEYRCANSGELLDLAQVYRDYLIGDKQLTGMKKPSGSMLVELVGGVRKQVSVLGIPMQQVVAITTFDQADQLLETMQKNGVNAMTVQYTNWAKNASDSRLTVDMKPDGALGGTGGLQKLTQKLAKQTGISLILDVNLTDLVNDQLGYSTKYDSAQTVQQEPALQYTYQMSTFRVDANAKLRYLLTPGKLLQAAQKTWESAEKWNVYGLSADSLGSKIYSDFGKNHEFDRGKTQQLFETVLSQLRKQKKGTLFSAANAYAFAYATKLGDVPVSCGGWQAQSQSVPFYSAALHGLVELYSQPINGNANSQKAYLQALENGLQLKYTLGSQHVDALQGTFLESESYISADLWMKDAALRWKESSGYLTAVSNQQMTVHQQLADGVWCTKFANGMGVVVNYNKAPVTANGKEVPAMGYLPIGW